MMRNATALATLTLATTIQSPASAHEDPELPLEEVIVEGRSLVLAREARSASEGIIGQQDLEIRPLLRTGDVLESVPGMIVTQHSGSGKSNQMYLRGFNLDHGTDFATWIDGMPVNMRSHGHGQGYTDLNFIIPETIQSIDFVKGPYHAELGDFSSAGGASLKTFDRAQDNLLRVGLGENGYRRLLAMGGTELGPGVLSGALEAQAYEGPWSDVDEDVDKTSATLTYSGKAGRLDWRVTAMHYDNTWNSADQIPTRAVSQGLIDELGSLDTTLGGESGRNSLSGSVSWNKGARGGELSAYAIDYDMNLWSNFTYLLSDPENGDQFEQVDERTIYGGNWRSYWSVAGGLGTFTHTLGAEIRYDDIGEVGLFQTRERRRIGTVRRDRIDQGSVGAFYELDWLISHHWRVLLGVRGDYYRFDVDSDNPLNSGDDSDQIFNPKASVIYNVDDETAFYLSAGGGFHSNDARGTTIRVDPASGESVDPVDPLVRSRGAEVGFKTTLWDALNTSLAVWTLELDSELLFVGDAGTTEASRPSKRWGLEFNNFWQLHEHWSLEADFAWTRSRFDDNEPDDRIPGALEFVASGAVNLQLPSGWFGSFRVRHFDGAPLTEDGSVESDGSTIAHLALGWGNDDWRVQLDGLNLFDSDDHDVDYFYASRLPGEPADGVEDVHFRQFEPRQFRLYLSRQF